MADDDDYQKILQLSCPSDKKPLVLKQSEGHIAYSCALCMGSWMPYNYLKSIALTHKFDAAVFLDQLKSNTQQQSWRHCPQGCGQLEQAQHHGQALDWCPSCHGVWFNQGEIEQLFTIYPLRLTPSEGGIFGALGRWFR